MLKLLLCVFSISPVAYFMVQGDRTDALTGYDSDEAVSVHFDEKIEALAKCQSASLSVFFHDDIVESHSATYIHEAAQASAMCDVTAITVQQLTVANATPEETDLAERRAVELKAMLEHYYTPSRITIETRYVKWDESVVERLGAQVDFTATHNTARTS